MDSSRISMYYTGLNELISMITIFVTFWNLKLLVPWFLLLFLFLDLRKLSETLTHSNLVKYIFINKDKNLYVFSLLDPSRIQQLLSILFIAIQLVIGIGSMRVYSSCNRTHWKHRLCNQGFLLCGISGKSDRPS